MPMSKKNIADISATPPNSAIALYQKYIKKRSSLKLKILTQILADAFDNDDAFPDELSIVIHPHEDTGLIRDLTQEVLEDLSLQLSDKLPKYEFSKTIFSNSNFITVIFKQC